MRIGIDARFYNPEASGLARYASELVPRLLNLKPAAEHEFYVYLPLDVPDIKTTHPKTTFIHTDIKNYTLQEQTTFKRLLEDLHLDLVHFLHFNHPLFYKGKTLFTIHDLILTFFPGLGRSSLKRWGYEITMRHALKSANSIIAVSQTTKREIVDHYHTDADKISVVYEAVDARYQKCDNQKLLTDLRSRYHIEKPYIVFVGQLRVHKNIVRLIEAFASIHARNRSVQLVLVGKADKHYLPLILSTIERLRLTKDVILTGFVPESDLPLFYSGAICSVTPSLIEGFGLPPLESMSCGCPVVSSNASCLPEIAGDGALYFDPRSVVDMADKLSTVLGQADLRQILVKAGHARIKAFSWDRMAEETLAIYQPFKEKKS